MQTLTISATAQEQWQFWTLREFRIYCTYGTGLMEQRVSIITLGVADLGRARAFYDALGWAIANEEQAGDIVAYDLAQMTLCLYPLDKLYADIGQPAPASGTFNPRMALAYNVASADDVARVLDEAVAVGATLIKPAEKVFWGGTSGYFADPDGNLWEVAHNPHVALGADNAFQWNGVKN